MNSEPEPSADTPRPDASSYERDLARARDEGTDIIERTDDLPPPDHYRAARDLAELLTGEGEDLDALAGEIGLPGSDPALWERLDVARAASYAHDTYGAAFARVAAAHPWLAEWAARNDHGALGTLGDRFLGG
jgi:hypothetical protein